MNPETLTQKIIKRADEELRQRIADAAKPLDALLRDGTSHTVHIHPPTAKPLDLVEVPWFSAITALIEKAFALHRDKNRELAINEFMIRVERLGDEIDHLRASIE